LRGAKRRGNPEKRCGRQGFETLQGLKPIESIPPLWIATLLSVVRDDVRGSLVGVLEPLAWFNLKTLVQYAG